YQLIEEPLPRARQAFGPRRAALGRAAEIRNTTRFSSSNTQEIDMSGTKLDIAFWNYDRAQALRDGEVRIDGVDAIFHNGKIVTDIFERMVKDRAYDVSDLGLSYFLRTMDT